MACGTCGGRKAGAKLVYEVKTKEGNTYTVDTMTEVRIKLNLEGGGSYRSVPKA